MDCLGRLSSSSESSLSEFPSVVRKSFEILRSANIYAAMRIGFGCQREDVGRSVAIGELSFLIRLKTPGRYSSMLSAKEYGKLAIVFRYPSSIPLGIESHAPWALPS